MSVEAWVLAWVKPLVEVTKDKNLVQVDLLRLVFEGGQMPLQRRLPKVGFSSRVSIITSQVTLSQLDKLTETDINIDVLKKHNLVTKNILRVKVMLSGEINRAINLVGIKPTKGARAAIEAAKGTISE